MTSDVRTDFFDTQARFRYTSHSKKRLPIHRSAGFPDREEIKMPSTEASENNQVLNTFHLTMINIAIVFTVRGFPMLAEEGLSSLFFLFFAAATFFIPAALVAAELATGWPPKGPGGIYIWTREALGEGWGFVAVWFQWIANVVWFPSLLSFIAATIAYIFAPGLSDNKFFILSVVLVVFWIFTLANCRDMKTSGWISTAGVVCSFMVAGFIILLGVLWLTSGRTSQVAFEADKLLPDMTHIHNIVFLAGAMVILAGIELSGGHKEAVINPKRTFPRAILLSALISVVLLGLGTLAVAVVIPQKDISLVSGVMQLFEKLLDAYHIKWLVPWAAVLVVAGSIGEVSSWIAGLAKGLFVTARDGLLPPWLARENRQGVPVNVLIIQAVIVTVFSAVFLCMPNVSAAYWLLTAMNAQLYLIMYIIMFASAIVLRYKQPNTPRAFRIRPGNIGIWVVAGVGILGGIFTLTIGFFPPSQIKTGSLLVYESVLIGGPIAMSLLALVIFRVRKATWRP